MIAEKRADMILYMIYMRHILICSIYRRYMRRNGLCPDMITNMIYNNHFGE